jgi:FixJ family two-component response regulator
MSTMIAENRLRFDRHCQEELHTYTPTVFVVDPDPATGECVKGLLGRHGIEVQSHRTGREFFSNYVGNCPGCIVLETRIFDASGFQIQRRLAEQNQRLPMVFVSSSIDVSTAVALMRDGAVHVMEKPLRSVELLDAIRQALALDSRQRQQELEDRHVRESIAVLTFKERCFVALLAEAKSIKAIASHLSISSRAVELRRRSVMDKLGFETSVELLRFALQARRSFGELLAVPAVELSQV